MTQRVLKVFLGHASEEVGTLWFSSESGREFSSFQYAQSWLENPKRFAIAPSLTLDDNRKFFKGGKDGKESPLPPPVADTTPDSWGREIIRKDNRTNQTIKSGTPLAEIDFLVAVDDFSRIGALRFQNPEDSTTFLSAPSKGSYPVPPLLHLSQLSEDVAHMEDGDATAAALNRLRGAGGSLGGARPKCSIIDTDERLAIAKFTSKRDTHAVERAEVLAIRLAQLCGLEVPRARIEMSGGLPVAIIERFDRRPDHKRIPFISAQTMLDASTAIGGTYVDLADSIRRHSANPSEDLKALLQRAGFYILISNVDDHLKNHGFLYAGNGRWRLSPAYDVNPSGERERTLKTAIADVAVPDASIEILMEHAFYFEVDPDDAMRMLSSMAQKVTAHWEMMARDLGMNRAEIDDYRPAFEHDEMKYGLALTGAFHPKKPPLPPSFRPTMATLNESKRNQYLQDGKLFSEVSKVCVDISHLQRTMELFNQQTEIQHALEKARTYEMPPGAAIHEILDQNSKLKEAFINLWEKVESLQQRIKAAKNAGESIQDQKIRENAMASLKRGDANMNRQLEIWPAREKVLQSQSDGPVRSAAAQPSPKVNVIRLPGRQRP